MIQLFRGVNGYERMLEALVNGVKGGKWFSLMDKVYAPRNLEASWLRARKNKGAAGVDSVTIARFDEHAQKYLDNLSAELRNGTYRPKPVKRVMIPKPGTTEKRPLGIPTVRDRIAQGAVRNVIEPIFEHQFHEHSYGFRSGRGAKDALRRVGELLRQGYHWVVDADIKAYFDTIDHDLLMAEVGKHVADGRVLALIRSFLEQSVMGTTRCASGRRSAVPRRGRLSRRSWRTSTFILSTRGSPSRGWRSSGTRTIS